MAYAAPADVVNVYEQYGQASNGYPIKLGRLFVKGEIPAGQFPQALVNNAPVLTQAEVKSRWSDDSVKHAILYFNIPVLPANGSVKVTFQGQPTCHCSHDGSGAGLTTQQMLDAGYDFDASITLNQAGVNKVAHAREMLAAGAYTRWADGPVATEIILVDHASKRFDMGWERQQTVLTASVKGAETTMHVADASGWTAPLDADLQQTDAKLNPVGFSTNPEHIRIAEIRYDSGSSGPATCTVIRHTSGNCPANWIVDAAHAVRVWPDRWTEPNDPKFSSFRPIFEAVFWPDGGGGKKRVQVRFIGEISDTERLQDLSYGLRLALGLSSPETVYAQDGIYHIAGIRWTMNRYDWADKNPGHQWTNRGPSFTYPREYWIGGAPTPAFIDHGAEYLGYSKAVFNYDLTKTIREETISRSWSGPWVRGQRNTGWTTSQHSGLTTSAYRSPKGSADMGNLAPIMGAGGGGSQPDATGPYPAWVIQWLYSLGQTHDHGMRMFLKMEGNAGIAAGGYPFNWREGKRDAFMDYGGAPGSGLGKPVSLAFRPKLHTNMVWAGADMDKDRIRPVSVTESQYEAYNSPCVANGWAVGTNHTLEPFSALYIVTGDFFWLEQMQFWTSWMAAYSGINTQYYTGRGPTGAEGVFPYMINGDPDGYGWSVRNSGGAGKTRILAAALSVDGTPEKAYYDHAVDNMLAGFEGALGYAAGFKVTGNRMEQAVWEWAKQYQHDADKLRTPASVGWPLNQFEIGDQFQAQSEYGIMPLGRNYTTADGGTNPDGPVPRFHPIGTEVYSVVKGKIGGSLSRTTSSIEAVLPVTNATNSTPIVVTVPGNTYQNGDSVWLGAYRQDAGIRCPGECSSAASTPYNYGMWGIWIVQNKNGDNFELAGASPWGGTTYVRGTVSVKRTFTVTNGASISKHGLPARLYLCDPNSSFRSCGNPEIIYVCQVDGDTVSICPIDNHSGARYADIFFGTPYIVYALGRGVDFEYKADWLFRYVTQLFVDGVNAGISGQFNPYLLDAGRFPSVKIDGHTLISSWPEVKAAFQPVGWQDRDHFALAAGGGYGEQLNLPVALAKEHGIPNRSEADAAWTWVQTHLHAHLDPNDTVQLKYLIAPRDPAPAPAR